MADTSRSTDRAQGAEVRSHQRWKGSSFTGLFPATVTPFDSDLALDVGDLERHLETTAQADGVNGLVVNGHIGEILALTSAEQVAVVDKAVQVRRPGQKVVAAVEGHTSDELVRSATDAVEAGADALLVLPSLDVRPYRRLFDDIDAVMHFMSALNDRVGVPLIVHQYPLFTGAAYSMRVLSEIVQTDSVVAIKAASVNVTAYIEVWDRFSDDVSILIATDAPAMLGMLLHGFHGALIGIGAIEPALWSRLLSIVVEEELVAARDLFKKSCLPLMHAVFRNQEPDRTTSEAAATKSALVELGVIKSPRVRPPAADATQAERHEIREALAQAGLLDPARL